MIAGGQDLEPGNHSGWPPLLLNTDTCGWSAPSPPHGVRRAREEAPTAPCGRGRNRHATCRACACVITTPKTAAGEASGGRTRRAEGRRCWRQDQPRAAPMLRQPVRWASESRADTIGLSAAAREEIASLATTRKLAARSRRTQLPPHPPASERRGCRGPKQVQLVDQRMRLECGVGFRQLRTCRRIRPGQLCAKSRQ